MSLQLTTKIGEGRSRECWETTDPHLIVKKPKTDVFKEYPSLGFTAHFSGRIYRLLAYGTADINRDEAKIVASLPPAIRAYVPETVRLEQSVEKAEPLLIMSRPRDYDGRPSVTVQQHGPVANDHFWKQIDFLSQQMQESEMYFCDIFFKGNNLLVHKKNAQEWSPVLIDVKRLGSSMYPYQLSLRFKANIREKFLRRLEMFKQDFRQDSDAKEQDSPSGVSTGVFSQILVG